MKKTNLEIVSNSGLAGFALTVIVLLIFAIPSDFEIGIFSAKSYRHDIAEGLLQKKHSLMVSDARSLRELSDVLEAQGKVNEAISILYKLVDIKPKNQSYWKRLSDLESWVGNQLGAVQAQEKYLRLNKGGLKKEDFISLARSYNWIDSEVNANRLYKEALLNNITTEEIADAAISSHFTAKEDQSVLHQVQAAISSGSLSNEYHGKIMEAYISKRNWKSATFHAAMALDIDETKAKEVWQDPAILFNAPPEVIQKNRATIERLQDIYAAADRIPASIKLFRARKEASLLSFTDHLLFIDTLDSTKNRRSAIQELNQLCRKDGFSNDEWRQIAKRYLWMGVPKQSTSILEGLVFGTRPNCLNLKKNRTIKTIKVISDFISTYSAQRKRQRSRKSSKRIINPTEKEFAVYQELLESYDAQSDHKSSIRLIRKILASQKIKISKSQRDELLERLVERYSWLNRNKSITKVLRRKKSRFLSAKTQLIYIKALYYTGQYRILRKLTRNKKPPKGLDQSQRKQWRDIYARLKTRDAEARRQRIASKNETLQEEFESIAEYYRPLDPLNEKYQNSLSVEGNWIGPRNDAVLISGIEYTHRFEERFDALKFNLAAEIVPKSSMDTFILFGLSQQYSDSAWWLQAGAAIGTSQIVPRMVVGHSGKWVASRYSSIELQIAEPVKAGESFFRDGISENSITYYEEREFSKRWLSTSEIKLRSTNHSKQFNRAKGGHLSNRTGYQVLKNERLTTGSWLYFNRWTTDDSILLNKFSRKNTTIGAFVTYEYWKQKNTQTKFYISSGFGREIAADAGGNNGFVETNIEQRLSGSTNLKFDYSYYSGDLAEGSQEGFHNLSLKFWIFF